MGFELFDYSYPQSSKVIDGKTYYLPPSYMLASGRYRIPFIGESLEFLAYGLNNLFAYEKVQHLIGNWTASRHLVMRRLTKLRVTMSCYSLDQKASEPITIQV